MNNTHRMLTFRLYIATVIGAIASINTSDAAVINEIRIDQSSTDTEEFFELVGTPLEDLSDLTYVVVGDGSAGSGVIESTISLSGQTADNNGFFVAAKSSFTIGTANLTTSDINFENSDNVTHLLVSGFTGSNSDDLDTNDDGELDVTPWTKIIDSIAIVETVDSGDHVYSDNRVGPDRTFAPGHVYRCGSFFSVGEFAVGANDSVGAVNADCTAYISEIRIDQPSADNDEYIEIAGASRGTLNGSSLIVIGDGSGGSGVVEVAINFDASHVINSNGLFTLAKSTFTLATADLVKSFGFENSDNLTFLLVNTYTGAVGDDLDTDDDGTFDATPWANIVDSVALIETIGSGDQVYSDTQVGPSGSFVPAHAYLCADAWRIGEFDPSDPNAADSPTKRNSCTASNDGGTITALTIPQIQGHSTSSPVGGQIVTTTGVVIADFQASDELKGFFMQDPVGDGDTATSDGIFVYDPSGTNVAVGDNITVTGNVSSFRNNTQLSSIASLVINSSNNTIAPTVISMPETVNGALEQYEGMLIQIDQTMTVSQTFFLARYGQLTLSSPNDAGDVGRLFNPTNQFPASSQDALDLANENSRRALILDDGQDISALGDNPDPTPYLGGPPATPLRSGDTISSLIGVLDEGQISGSSSVVDYRLHPTVAPVFIASNPRQSRPEQQHTGLKIASFNVLNYFNTIDTGGSPCGPLSNQRCRGADSAFEFTRQRDKIINALTAIDADIVGLIEIENNGLGAGSAIQDLVNGLNAALGNTQYAVLPVSEGATPGIGGDAIAVGFIHKPAAASIVGTPAVLASGAFDQSLPSGRNRQPIAASFRDTANGEIITVAVNHFKSKGSPPTPALGNNNDDQGDGQGPWNLRRTTAANDLSDWLATGPTGIQDSDILIIGDINAYAQEDPMLAFERKGYTNLQKKFEGSQSYTYTFDGHAGSLDHALSSPSLVQKVASVESWHINTDEPTLFDYNVEFKGNIQAAPTGYYSPDPFRSSDHDPLIITLSRETETSCYVIKTTNNKVVTFCL